jgi:hypothetical protein
MCDTATSSGPFAHWILTVTATRFVARFRVSLFLKCPTQSRKEEDRPLISLINADYCF